MGRTEWKMDSQIAWHRKCQMSKFGFRIATPISPFHQLGDVACTHESFFLHKRF
jgi:hypothetical protein